MYISAIKINRKKARRAAAVFISLLILLGPVSIFIARKDQTSAAWYDDAYAYRQRISFTHNAALTNQSIRLTVSNTNTLISNNKMQSDCDDTVFTDSAGQRLLFKLVSGCNSASTTYDVIFKTVINGTNIGYVYYGNPIATSMSNSSVPNGITPNGGTPSISTEEKGQGPILYLRLDDGSGQTAQDSTAKNNDGTLGSSSSVESTDPTWQPESMCVVGKCLYFDGSNDYITGSSLSNFTAGSSITIQTWFKATAVDGTQNVILDGPSDFHFRLEIGTDNKLHAYFGNGSLWGNTSLGVSNNTVSANKWYFVTARLDTNAQTAAIFINGLSEKSWSDTATTGTPNGYRIGRYAGATGNEFKGYIDEVKIYNYARSDAQIKLDYNSKISGTVKGAAVAAGDNNNINLNNGLVGYWKMDETAANTCTGGVNDNCDYSGNGNDGAWNGNTTTGQGKFGNGTVYDGTGDYVNIGDPASGIFDFGTGDFTVSAWFNMTSITNWTSIVNKGASGSGGYGLTISSSIKLCGDIQATSGGSNQHVCGNTTLQTSTWYHGVVVFKRNDKAYVYLNGKYETSAAYDSGNTGDISNAFNLTMGTYKDGSTFPLNGKIDEVRIYNRALSEQEARQLYDWSTGPLGYWKLDEGSGTTVSDSSGNGYTGTIAGNPTWQAGKYGQSISLDGTGDKVSMGVVDTGTGGVTYEAWIYPTAFEPNAPYISMIMGVENAANTSLIRLGDGGLANNKLQFVLKIGGGDAKLDGNTGLTANTWYHVAATYDGAKQRIFINGVLDSERSQTGTVAGNQQFLIGDSYEFSGREFTGLIDEAKVYTYARTQKQIVEDINASHPAPGSPVGSPLLHWKLDEGANNMCRGGVNDACNSGNGGSSYDGAETGTAISSSGKMGKARTVDTVSDTISAGDVNGLDSATAMTVSFWVNPSLLTTDDRIIGKWTSGNTSNSFRIMTDSTNSDELRVYIASSASDATNYYVTSNLDLATSTWQQVVVVYDGTLATADRVKVYKNAVLKTGTTVNTIPTSMTTGTTSSLILGDVEGNSNALLASYDDVRIFTGALSSDQVKQELNQGKAMVLGAGSTDTDGKSSSNASNRAYCPPGNTEGNCAAGQSALPLGEWSFEEGAGTTVYNTGTGGVNGTLVGSNGYAVPVYQSGKFGKGLRFNYGNGVSLPDNTYNSLGTGTLEFWFKPAVLGGAYHYDGMFYVPGGAGILEFGWIPDAGYVELWMQNSGGSLLQTRTPVINNPLTQWHHFAYAVDESSGWSVYIDGIKQNMTDNDQSKRFFFNDLTGTVAYRIGCSPSGSNCGDVGSNESFSGSMDQVRIFNYVRTPAQIAWDYNQGNPIGWWKFDEGTGSTANDSTGNLNTGTLVNSPVWADGKINTGIDLEYSNNNYISVANESNFDITGSMSISAWVKVESVPTIWSPIITKGDSAWRLTINGAAGTKPNFSTTGLSEVDTQGNTDIATDGQWHHITAVYDASAGKKQIYVDGKLDKETSSVTGTISTNNISVEIGRNGFETTRTFDGIIDDVRVYNYNLSTAQVKLIYNNGGAIRYAPLTGTP